MNSTVTATFRIVTPMFLGDADQNESDIRPPSIKGALRFWWRALNWSRFANNNLNNEAQALCQLHDEEARLFGIAAGDVAGGQGVFLLNVTQSKIERSKTPFKDMSSSQLYLLGMGLGRSFKYGNHKLRNAIIDGEFSVRLLFRPKCTLEDRKSIADALFAFGLMGALGSRARHGMGSISLKEWCGDDRQLPTTKQEYKSVVIDLIGLRSNTSSPLTAFARETRIDLSATDKDVFKLLTFIGTEQQMYRSFGRKGTVLGKPKEPNFTADHDLIMNVTKGQRVNKAPQRAVFGLPHNYVFSSNSDSNKEKADVDYAPNGTAGRRSSPLFLHVHALGDGEFVALHCLFQSQFLPRKAQIRIKGRVSTNVPADVDWQVLHTYLNRFKQRETIYGK